MPPRSKASTIKSLQKLNNDVQLSRAAIKEKSKQLRERTRKLKNCTSIILALCNHVLPHSHVKINVKDKHLTAKKAKQLGYDKVVKQYNELMAIASLQSDAFKYTFDVEAFLIQAVAKQQEEFEKLNKKLTALNKDIEKAMKTKSPKVKTVVDVGDCSDSEKTTHFNLFI